MMKQMIRENKNQKAAQRVSVSSVVSLSALFLAPVSVLALIILVIFIQVIIIPIESPGMV